MSCVGKIISAIVFCFLFYIVYIDLTIVFTVHPAVADDPVNIKLEPDTITVNAIPAVVPKSVVVVSVKLTDDPLHMDIICPARAFEPDRTVYSNQAPSYDAVGIE